jgi:hypothetical protein
VNPPSPESVTHEIAGNRFFPATIGSDDPGVNDELSLPTVDNFETGDDRRFGSAMYPLSSPNVSPQGNLPSEARWLVTAPAETGPAAFPQLFRM